LGNFGSQGARDPLDAIRDGFGLFTERGREREEAAERWKPCTAEEKALSVLGMKPPAVFAEIKARYKELVKLLHPDANGGDKGAEEQLKVINQAYSTLKQAARAQAEG
jgi:DnaJ-domain-containing protein 1